MTSTPVKLPQAAEPTPPRPWPAWYALVTSWLLPATTTRRMMQVSLLAAALLHLPVVLLFAALGITVIGFDYVVPNSFVALGAWQMVHFSAAAFFAEARIDPSLWLKLALATAAFEAAWIFLAFILAPFAAQRAGIRRSWSVSLRRIWLHTPHLAIVLIVFVVLPIGLEHAALRLYVRSWRTAMAVVPRMPRPKIPENSPIGACAWQQFRVTEAARDSYRSSLATCRVARFLHRWHLVILHGLGIAGGAWLGWAILRGLTAGRSSSDEAAAPNCVDCGYDLRGLPPTGRCPECGLPLADSIATGFARVRPRHPLLQAWRCALVRPEELGAHWYVGHRHGHATRVLALHLLALLCLTCVVVIAKELNRPMDRWVPSNRYLPEVGLGDVLQPLPWLLISGGMLLITGLAAWWATYREYRRSSRNILPVAADVAFLLSARPTAHMLVLMGLVQAMFAYPQAPRAVARALGARWADPTMIAAVVVFAVLAVSVPTYIRRVARIAPRVRHMAMTE